MTSRRSFLTSTTAAYLSLSSLPLLGQTPTSGGKKFRTTLIGAGWWGMNILREVVALCDVDETVQDLVRLGRDLEKTVLAKALWWHVRDQVLVVRNKTVVFG